METDPQRWITALRTAHEGLVDASRPSAMTGSPCRRCAASGPSPRSWHLGSGAEIGRSALVAATGGPPTIGAGGNEAVWARWNAMTPAAMAAAFVAADRALVETYEGLDDEQLTTVRVDLGFLPEPLDLASLAGMRLGEHALHSWDVTATFDHDSEVEAGACALLIDRLPVMVALIGGFMPRETRPTPGATIRSRRPCPTARSTWSSATWPPCDRPRVPGPPASSGSRPAPCCA